jgi:hypothetical protein
MGFLGSIASAVTDPGKIVRDVADAVLPEKLDVVADLAGAVVNFQTGRPVQGMQLVAQALKDLPQALADGDASAAARGWRGTPAFDPNPPEPRRPDTEEPKWDKLFSLLESIKKALDKPDSTSATKTSSKKTSSKKETDDGDEAGGAKKTTSKTTSSKTTSSKSPPTLEKLEKMSDADFMAALRSGNLPKEVTDDPAAMLAIQARMNHISEMNKLMTNMMQAMHDMQMSVIQNVRV